MPKESPGTCKQSPGRCKQSPNKIQNFKPLITSSFLNFSSFEKNYAKVTYSAPESAKKSVKRVFKMSILDLLEARLSGVREFPKIQGTCERSLGTPKRSPGMPKQSQCTHGKT